LQILGQKPRQLNALQVKQMFCGRRYRGARSRLDQRARRPWRGAKQFLYSINKILIRY
jgi:hypothetical protein